MSQWVGFLCEKTGRRSVGVIGFCMGGRFSLLLSAREQRIGSCAAVYPSLYEPRLPNQEEDAVARAAAIGCPVVTIYPGRDHVTSAETFRTLQANLLKRTHATTIQYYPGAQHGFLHHHGEANESASRLAWPQIVTFLQSTLIPTDVAVGLPLGA
jgi:carboxymethylenebutenolidase